MLSVNIQPITFQTRQFGNIVVEEKTANRMCIASVEPLVKDQSAKVRVMFYNVDETGPFVSTYVGDTTVDLNAEEYNGWVTDNDLIETVLNKLNLAKA